MRIKNIWITIKKELRSIFRDRKTFYIMLIFPLLIPAMIFLYSYMYGIDEKNYDVGVNYQLSSTEKDIITNLNLTIHEYKNKEELDQAYQKGEISGYVEYEKDNLLYTVYADESSTTGMIVSKSLEGYLVSYNELLAKQYISDRGVDVNEAYSQINYQVVNLQKDGQDIFLNLIYTISFTYIIMAIAMAAINMATSTTAVEKENGTLETILTFPIKSSELIIGKYISTVIIGLISSLTGLALTVGSLALATRLFDAFKNVGYSISISAITSSIIVIIAAALFISGLAIALTCFAKSYKEAQSKAQILTSITLIPMFISMLDIEISRKYYLIPIANYTTILMDIFSGEINSLNLLIVLLSSVVYVVLIIWYIIRQYNSEKVLFTD